MEKREGYLQFVHSDSYKHQIDIWYKAHNISREKTELFYDFLVSLSSDYNLLGKSMVGSELIWNLTDPDPHLSVMLPNKICNKNSWISLLNFAKILKYFGKILQDTMLSTLFK